MPLLIWPHNQMPLLIWPHNQMPRFNTTPQPNAPVNTTPQPNAPVSMTPQPNGRMLTWAWGRSQPLAEPWWCCCVQLRPPHAADWTLSARTFPAPTAGTSPLAPKSGWYWILLRHHLHHTFLPTASWLCPTRAVMSLFCFHSCRWTAEAQGHPCEKRHCYIVYGYHLLRFG